MANKLVEEQKKEFDDSTEQLYKAYRRRLAEFGLKMPKKIEDIFEEIRDDKEPEPFPELLIWEHYGPNNLRAIAEAFRDVEYPHLQRIRLWRSGAGLEGVRSVMQFLMTESSAVALLELIDSNICPLTCEVIGNSLQPDFNNSLQVLKLDRNEFGSAGIIGLAKGLCMNMSLQVLSLTYCTIDDSAGPALRAILINQYSLLNELELQGNFITKEGVELILHGLQVNPNLTKLGLADNEFGEEEEVLEAFKQVVLHNQTLQIVDLRYSNFTEHGVHRLIGIFKENPDNGSVLSEFNFLAKKFPPKVLSELDKCLEANKRGKKPKKINLALT